VTLASASSMPLRFTVHLFTTQGTGTNRKGILDTRRYGAAGLLNFKV